MGPPAKVVQKILGHSHISSTLGIYALVLPGMHKDAMNKLMIGSGVMMRKTPLYKGVGCTLRYYRCQK